MNFDVPRGFFETLLTLAIIGIIALLVGCGWMVYFLFTHVSIVWGAA